MDEMEETIRATVISLYERGMLTRWPLVPDMDIIISDVQEMNSAKLDDEEAYDELNEYQPDWYQEWHDFDPDC